MTSDAKIGLLLGLVFIFMIAFIINGLPSFSEERNNNELTGNMVGLQNNLPGIGTKERKASSEVVSLRGPVEKHISEVQPPPAVNQDIRFMAPLPKSASAVNEAEKTIEIKRATAPPIIAKESEVRRVESVERTAPKIYVVKEGDSLGVIAMKFYGPKEGNKRISIDRIFRANRELLKLPDEIYEGQKIVIPLLPASCRNEKETDNIFAGTKLAKVESVGKRHLLTDGRRIKQSRQYVVREGDSLWRIAAGQLGDGSRYAEIARLNAGILEDEDSLIVGMRLTMPAR